MELNLEALTYNRLGWELLELGRFDDAIVAYEKALELYPDYTTAEYNLARAIRQRNTKPEADDLTGP